jgi:hypothetical protein
LRTLQEHGWAATFEKFWLFWWPERTLCNLWAIIYCIIPFTNILNSLSWNMEGKVVFHLWIARFLARDCLSKQQPDWTIENYSKMAHTIISFNGYILDQVTLWSLICGEQIWGTHFSGHFMYFKRSAHKTIFSALVTNKNYNPFARYSDRPL